MHVTISLVGRFSSSLARQENEQKFIAFTHLLLKKYCKVLSGLQTLVSGEEIKHLHRTSYVLRRQLSQENDYPL